MTDLRTFKDIPLPSLSYDDSMTLKQEAIKWIKEITGKGFDLRPKLMGMPIEEGDVLAGTMFRLQQQVSTKLMIAETDIVVRWIKHFFNMRESDLI